MDEAIDTCLRRTKILFVLPALKGGGAERSAVDILNHLNSDRFEKVLVLYDDESVYDGIIGSDIHVVRCKSVGHLDRFYKARRIIREENPDCVVTFLSHFTTLILKLLGGSFRLILDEQNPPLRVLRDDNFFANRPIKVFLIRILIRYLYQFCDNVIVISNGIGRELMEHFKVPVEKIVQISNPVNLRFIRSRMGESSDFKKEGAQIIVSVGRLAQQKGYPVLFEAIPIIKNSTKSPLFFLVLGEGPERKNLEQMVKKLGIEKEVVFLGFQENPWKYMFHSDVFVLPSLYEGFGNVIIEAMACGIPVVSTLCDYGPREIITDGIDGLLVPPGDPEALADAVVRLLLDADLGNRLKIAAMRRVEDFDVAKIAEQYAVYLGGRLH